VKLVPIEKICGYGRQGTSLLAAFAALALAAQCHGATATSAVSSMTSSAPGGFIFDGTRNWVADGAKGLCRMDPAGGGAPAGSFTLTNCVLPPTSSVLVPAIVGQPAYDSLSRFVYLPDQSTASLGIWRYSFNGSTFGGGVNIGGIGAQRPGAIAFGTDGNLYATMTANASILRINTPAGATQVVDKMSTTLSGLPAQGLALVGTQLWVADRDGILDIVDPIGCATACRGAILTQIVGLTSPLSITWDTVNSYVYMGTPFGVVRLARITGVTDTYSRSYLKGAVPGLMSDVTAVGLDGAGNLLLVDDPTAGQVVGGATVYSVPFFIPGSVPPVQSLPDGQGAVPQPPITLLPTIFPIPISNPGAFYAKGLTTPRGAVFMGTHLWVVDAALGFCKVDPTKVPSLTACATLPLGFVPGSPAYDAVGHFVYLADTTAAGAGILRFPFITAAGLTNETLGLSSTVVKITPLTNAAPGSSAPTALAFGPDSQLYVAMAGSSSILRVTAPATDPKAPAIHSVTSVGTMFESSLSIAFHNADLFNTETVDSSTLFNATLCKGTCTSLFLAVVLNAPGAVASDANFVYIGDAGGIVWRYDPVADTITRLADTGQPAAGVLTPFSAISGLAVDNLGQVTIVDQTTVWKLSTAVSTITSMAPLQSPEGSSPTVTITGTNFLPAMVVNTCAAITPGNVTFVSPTQITATFVINPAGPVGPCTVTVATANGTSIAGSFKVLIGPPFLTSITPLTGFRGKTVPFSISGVNMTAGVLTPMAGIAFSGTVVTDALITTNLIIDPAAAVTTRIVSVTTPSGLSNTNLTFSVQAPLPVLTGITPTQGVANTTVPVIIAGTDLVGATLNLPTGFTLSGIPVVGSTSITANLVIASTVPAGTQNITVTTLGGTSNAVVFLIQPKLTSIAPATAKAGTATPITLTGNSLLTATINAGANITVSNVVVVNVNSITATFTTAANSPLGAQSITVTDPVGGTSNAVTFTITAPTPSITSIAPNTGVRGTTVPVILTGSGLVGATFTALPTGITVSGTPVVTFGQITANFVIATDAPLGAQSINVTTPGGTTTNVGNFTVTAPVPTLVSVNPAQGTAATTVAVTFTGTGLVGGTLNLPTGFTLSGTPVVAASGTTITASLVIVSTVAAGPQSITVTTPGGTSNAVTFNILPALTSIATVPATSPTQARAGATTNITLTGTSLLGVTAVNAGANITVTNVVVVNATTITATFASAPAAPVGPVNVTVTGPAGTSAAVVFTLTGPIPVISSISPATGGTGATVPITVTGTGLTLGTLNLPVGVTVVGTPVVSFTQITASLLIAGNAPLGAQTISVTTPGVGNTSNAFPFTVFALAPTLTSVAPTTGVAGTSVTVTLTGTGFAAGTTVITGDAFITVSGLSVVSPTQISATLVIGANAASTQIWVNNSNGPSNKLTFGIVPTLASINPTQGVAGTNVPVTLTGTSFTGATAINTGTAGITVSGLTIVSNTQITATFVIAVGATQGNHSISVTTPGGTTAQVVNFNVLPPAPAITSLNNTTISKASRNVGMNVNGSNLGNLPISSMQILLNGLAIDPTFVTITNFAPSQTQIRFNWTFNAPAPISGAGNVYTLKVTTPSGFNAIGFTVTN
jgi:hypothetical protein